MAGSSGCNVKLTGDQVADIIENYVMDEDQNSLKLLENLSEGSLASEQWKDIFKKFQYGDDDEVNSRLTDALFMLVERNPNEKVKDLISAELISKFKEEVRDLIIEDLSRCDGRMAESCAARGLLEMEDWEKIFKNLHYKEGMRNHSYNNDLTNTLTVATNHGKNVDMINSMTKDLRDGLRAELDKFGPSNEDRIKRLEDELLKLKKHSS